MAHMEKAKHRLQRSGYHGLWEKGVSQQTTEKRKTMTERLHGKEPATVNGRKVGKDA